MSAIEFPSSERVSVIGGLSNGEVVWVVAALMVFVFSLFTATWAGLGVSALLLVWCFAPNRREPLRVRAPARVRWVLRRDKVWSMPLRGGGDAPAPFLNGVELLLGRDVGGGGAVGVVCDHRATYTAMMRVSRASMVFESDEQQEAMFGGWAEVLAGLCVERGSDVSASFVGWTDVHRAADPQALVAHHASDGVAGPASEDYSSYLGQFGHVAAAHEVIVWVTLRRAEQFRAAKRSGFSGSVDEVMSAATVASAKHVAAALRNRGFTVSELLNPAEVSRVIERAIDPYRPEEPLTHRERAGLAEWRGPRQVTATRSCAMVDRAFHRGFAVEFPRSQVDPAWLWRPLGLDGPKLTTAVFVPIPPSRADMQREAATTRGFANNRAAAGSSRGRVRERDRRKLTSLARAEVAVAEGHQELDAYMVVVLAATSAEELERRTQQFRQRLREVGRAQARELPGLHDDALGFALPLGRLAGRSGG